MIKICENVYTGNDYDYKMMKDNEDMFFINAAKEPYHRNAVGYFTKGAPMNDEYYYCERGNRLILNLIDANDERYIPKVVIDKAISYLDEHKDKVVLINCNLGHSRSASIGMLYLKHIGFFKGEDYKDAMLKYKEINPEYLPNKGMLDYTIKHWDEY